MSSNIVDQYFVLGSFHCNYTVLLFCLGARIDKYVSLQYHMSYSSPMASALSGLAMAINVLQTLCAANIKLAHLAYLTLFVVGAMMDLEQD